MLVNLKLKHWIQRRFEKFARYKSKAFERLCLIVRNSPGLFVHWNWVFNLQQLEFKVKLEF